MGDVLELTTGKKVRAVGGGRKKTKPSDSLALAKELLIRTPTVPEEIKGDAIAAGQWQLFAPLLVKRKILKIQHLPQLTQLCRLYSIWKREIEICEKDGYTIMGSEGAEKTNPHFNVAMKAHTEYKSLASLFMLDPTSENRFVRAEESKENENPFDAFK